MFFNSFRNTQVVVPVESTSSRFFLHFGGRHEGNQENGREGKGREGKGRKGKGREGDEGENKGRKKRSKEE